MQHVPAGDDQAASKEELGKGRQQVSDSRSRLLKLKTQRDLEVSAVRVTGDERESQRRSKEEEERQVLQTVAAFVQEQRLGWQSLLTARLIADSSLLCAVGLMLMGTCLSLLADPLAQLPCQQSIAQHAGLHTAHTLHLSHPGIQSSDILPAIYFMLEPCAAQLHNLGVQQMPLLLSVTSAKHCRFYVTACLLKQRPVCNSMPMWPAGGVDCSGTYPF